ncbi:hypothetical protein [Paraburkholderia hayleyella]|uniref:hypothetical protein n=1 Tax=Paraburkholderia hayleyella TaxID=2152889 RepID=UPI001292A1CD|nr:hypothetical protein [Paraburkholderia hayleyella]
MVEFLVAAMFVMGVMFFALAMMGKFNDVRNKTLAGARYIAWERTVWLDSDSPSKSDRNDYDWYYGLAGAGSKNDQELQHEYLQRVLAVNSMVKSDDKTKAESPAIPTMWHDHSGEAFISDMGSNIIATTDMRASPTPQLDRYSGQSFGKIDTVGKGMFEAKIWLATRNLVAATLSVSVAHDNAALTSLFGSTYNGLTFRDTNVLLTNPWVANGRNSTWYLTAGAIVSADERKVIDPSIYQPLKKYSPDIATLDVHRTAKDIVPKDRLAP